MATSSMALDALAAFEFQDLGIGAMSNVDVLSTAQPLVRVELPFSNLPLSDGYHEDNRPDDSSSGLKMTAPYLHINRFCQPYVEDQD